MREVPSYQNFVPGIGHRKLPSAHEVKDALLKGAPAPEETVTQEVLVRIAGPVRKSGFENFIPGKGHKLMPTWAQIQAAEAEAEAVAAEEDPEAPSDPASLVESFPCPVPECGASFTSARGLHGHKKAHR